MQLGVVRAFVSEEQRSIGSCTRFDDLAARGLVRVLDHLVAIGLGGPAHHHDHRRLVIVILFKAL
jgi:hypothetical protein